MVQKIMVLSCVVLPLLSMSKFFMVLFSLQISCKMIEFVQLKKVKVVVA